MPRTRTAVTVAGPPEAPIWTSGRIALCPKLPPLEVSSEMADRGSGDLHRRGELSYATNKRPVSLRHPGDEVIHRYAVRDHELRLGKIVGHRWHPVWNRMLPTKRARKPCRCHGQINRLQIQHRFMTAPARSQPS
jgi:hypothetical protein